MDRLFDVIGGAYHPDLALFHFLERSREVGDGDIGHRFSRTGRDLHHRRVETHRAIFWRDDSVYAGSVSRAQACAQVVRIGDAVQYENQGHLIQTIENVVQ